MRNTPLLAASAAVLGSLLVACGAPEDASFADPQALPVGDADAEAPDDGVADDPLDEAPLDDEPLDDDAEGEVAEEDVLEEEVVVDEVEDDTEAEEVDDVIVDDTDDEIGDDTAGDVVVEEEVVGGTGGSLDDGPTAVTKTLRTLHWNIAGGKLNDCRTPGITRAVLRYVREHDIDFVGLNEVCPSQYRSIKEALRKHWGKRRGVTFSAYVDDGDSGRVVGNAIYSRRRFDVISRQRLGHDQYGTRNLICGRVALKKHLRFCSTHLTPGDATARLQLKKVHDRVEGWWQDRKDTVILSGDLNINPNDHALNKVYAAAANTPNNPNNHGRYRELDDDDPNHCRGYGERSHAGNGGPCGQGGKIDFIFARGNRIVDGTYRADSLNIPGDCTGACSDHRAIVGTARLRIRLD